MIRLAPTLTLAAVVLAAVPPAAHASTMPTGDLHARELSFNVTAANLALAVVPIPGFAVDYGITETLSVGAATNFWGTQARATLRFLEGPSGLTVAAVAAGGANHNFQTLMGVGPFNGYPVYFGEQPGPDARGYPNTVVTGPWGQPALAVSLPLGGANSPFVLRGMVGPVFGSVTVFQSVAGLDQLQLRTFSTMVLLPNLELAYRPQRSFELTLGGYDLIGMRYRF